MHLRIGSSRSTTAPCTLVDTLNETSTLEAETEARIFDCIPRLNARRGSIHVVALADRGSGRCHRHPWVGMVGDVPPDEPDGSGPIAGDRPGRGGARSGDAGGAANTDLPCAARTP